MLAASLVFLTPAGALVGLSAALPLAAVAIAARRERRGREGLGLPTPPRVSRVPRVAALLCVVALMAVAAAQPALKSTTRLRVRTDAQAFFVIDNSRSMLAAARPGSPTRLARAKAAAMRLRNALADVPSGVGTMTDRVLPNLLPTSDPGVFAATVRQAIQIEEPPPTITDVVATSLGSIGAVATQNYFSPSARKRLLVVLTDGESRPFDARQVARELATRPGVALVLVDLEHPGEAVYVGGQPETGYREDPASHQTLASLAAATGGTLVSDGSLGSAVSAARRYLGSGPAVAAARTTRVRTLAPFVILIALAPLLFLLWAGLVRSLRTLLHAGGRVASSSSEYPLTRRGAKSQVRSGPKPETASTTAPTSRSAAANATH